MYINCYLHGGGHPININPSDPITHKHSFNFNDNMYHVHRNDIIDGKHIVIETPDDIYRSEKVRICGEIEEGVRVIRVHNDDMVDYVNIPTKISHRQLKYIPSRDGNGVDLFWEPNTDLPLDYPTGWQILYAGYKPSLETYVKMFEGFKPLAEVNACVGVVKPKIRVTGRNPLNVVCAKNHRKLNGVLNNRITVDSIIIKRTAIELYPVTLEKLRTELSFDKAMDRFNWPDDVEWILLVDSCSSFIINPDKYKTTESVINEFFDDKNFKLNVVSSSNLAAAVNRFFAKLAEEDLSETLDSDTSNNTFSNKHHSHQRLAELELPDWIVKEAVITEPDNRVMIYISELGEFLGSATKNSFTENLTEIASKAISELSDEETKNHKLLPETIRWVTRNLENLF